METYVSVTKIAKRDVYEEIIPQLRSLLDGDSEMIANLANTAAVLKMAFPKRISWVGFYLRSGNDLVLGPFQGKPACVRIAWGKGVCGTAAARAETVVVPDVEQFPGHIACDPDSRSEIVLPLIQNNKLLGVLDVDSPQLDSFDDIDRTYLEEIVGILGQTIG